MVSESDNERRIVFMISPWFGDLEINYAEQGTRRNPKVWVIATKTYKENSLRWAHGLVLKKY